MSCDSSNFSPDFFNNVAAVAVVLMFTKVVSQRTGKAGRGQRRTHLFAAVHAVAVLAAALAIGAGLRATESCSDIPLFHNLAWAGLVIATAAILFDVLVHDLRGIWASPRAELTDLRGGKASTR